MVTAHFKHSNSRVIARSETTKQSFSMDKEIASSPSAPRNDRRGTVRNDTRGASVIEYIVLTIIVLSSLYVMYNTISRGIFGKHKVAGDAFAFGRQYDARRTTTCRQDFTYSQNGTPINGVFYDEDCYQTRLMRPLVNGGCTQGDFACEDVIKNSCISDYCNQ